MTSERQPLAEAFATVDAAFRTAADDLQSKGAAVGKVIRKFGVVVEKYRAIGEKAQRYQAWRAANGL